VAAIEPIRTRRLLLAPLVAGDAEALAGLADVLRADSLDAVRARFAAWESRRSPDGREAWLNWCVRRDGAAVGWVQATVRGRLAEVGYAVLPAERGHGYAAEAVGGVVHRLFRDGVERVEAHIAESNPASGRVAAAAGFQPGERFHDGEVVWEAVAPAAR
jgi:RimJ/RimL family protein N-acetyltransferase